MKIYVVEDYNSGTKTGFKSLDNARHFLMTHFLENFEDWLMYTDCIEIVDFED